MSELINKKYLDFSGLQKYDELIKKFIATGNNELAAAIAALDDVGGKNKSKIHESDRAKYRCLYESNGRKNKMLCGI